MEKAIRAIKYSNGMKPCSIFRTNVASFVDETLLRIFHQEIVSLFVNSSFKVKLLLFISKVLNYVINSVECRLNESRLNVT